MKYSSVVMSRERKRAYCMGVKMYMAACMELGKLPGCNCLVYAIHCYIY